MVTIPVLMVKFWVTFVTRNLGIRHAVSYGFPPLRRPLASGLVFVYLPGQRKPLGGGVDAFADNP